MARNLHRRMKNMQLTAGFLLKDVTMQGDGRMRIKVAMIFSLFAVFWVLAAAEPPRDSKSIQLYSEELLRTRRGMEQSGYTSIQTLEERLAKLSICCKDQSGTFDLCGNRYGGATPLQTKSSLSDRTCKAGRSAAIPDMLVNEETYPSSFNQSNPSVCLLPDLRFITVWEDERNGDIDIFAQKYTFAGNPEGNNLEVQEEDFPKDQFSPCVSPIDDTSLVLLWVDEQSFDVYGKRFTEDLASVGQAFQISDSPLPFTTWSTAVSSGPDGKFVVVWADTRSGSNIYARRFDAEGNPLGASFKVNGDDGSKLHTSPKVSVGSSGNFVVVWEDFRDLDADVYAQRFDTDGAFLGENILVNLDSLDEDQYTPDVTVGLNDRFVVTWIDLRHGEEAVFARSFSFGDPLADTVGFSLTSDTSSIVSESAPVVWDTLGGFTIGWVEYITSGATVYAQRFDSLGQVAGDTINLSDLLSTGERHGLSLSVSPGGYLVATWMDRRSGNYDIYAQRVNPSGFPQGDNLILNDDETGANQNLPQIAVRPDGGFVVVWEDMRRGNLDIFMKRFDQQAQALGNDFMVNDSLGRIYHGRPDVSCDSSGNFVVVWEDARDGGLNVYAQLFDQSGGPNGGNFRVNCEGMSNSSSPSCDMSPQGDLVLVWSSTDGITKSIYGRLFASTGEPIDTCFKINDDTLSVDHLSPRVAVDSSGGFVVAWEDKREGQARIYLQRFASDGSKVDTNFAVYSDKPSPVQYDVDLDLNADGDFIVTWTEPYFSSTMIFAQQYDRSGVPIGANIMVVDDPSASPASPKVKLADDGHAVVAWTDFRAQGSDIYCQTFLSGLPQGNNRKVNTDPDNALQFFPDIGMRNPYLYSVWADNRAPGWGFSIFFNTINYTETQVEDRPSEDCLPAGFALHQNYPNPFNPATSIRYLIGAEVIPGSSHRAARVSLEIYNVLGRRVRTLLDEKQLPGTHQVAWDGKDDNGMDLSSGVYFYKLKVKGRTATRKMLLLK